MIEDLLGKGVPAIEPIHDLQGSIGIQFPASALNPFSRTRLPKVPNILQVLVLSMLAHRRPDLPLSETDILIRPELPDDLRFTSWERHNEVFLHAYRGVASWIQARVAQRDPAVLAVIGGGAG